MSSKQKCSTCCVSPRLAAADAEDDDSVLRRHRSDRAVVMLDL